MSWRRARTSAVIVTAAPFYEYLSKKLGADRVLFLPCRLKRADVPAYARLLAEFFGVPVCRIRRCAMSSRNGSRSISWTWVMRCRHEF